MAAGGSDPEEAGHPASHCRWFRPEAGGSRATAVVQTGLATHGHCRWFRQAVTHSKLQARFRDEMGV